MIISKLVGGIGNQLFQWAIARSYSIKWNCDYKIEVSFYNTQDKRKNILDSYINIDHYHLGSSILPISINDTYIFDQIEKKISLYMEHDIYLIGYWQTEKYFKNYRSIIIDDLKINKSNDYTNMENIYRKAMNFGLNISDLNNTVSLHVRRGDYLESNGYHTVQNISYYERSVSEIGSYDNMLVFSDDINWCKNNLKFNNMIFIDDINPKNTILELDDMELILLMSLCKNNIISNSSFSWWGAWLNQNKNKKVISPSKWFGDHVKINQSDIIPNEWIKI